MKNYDLDIGKTSFTGSNLDDLRVFEGAMKNKVDFEGEDNFTFNAAFEYLDSYYATAIESTLSEAVNSFDFDSDSFFLTEPEIVDNTDQFDCSVKADLVVQMDMSKKSMKKIAQKCESLIPHNTDICRSQELNQAEDNWFNYCSE